MPQTPLSKSLLLPALLVVVAGLSIWLLGKQDIAVPVARSGVPGPDSYMENATTQVFDPQGTLRYRLQAERVAYFREDRRSEFTAPRFIRYRADGQRWTLEAERGVSQGGADRILLQGAVVMRRVAADNRPANLEIHTRDVLIQPEQDTAETVARVVVNRGDSTLHSVGLKAFFEEGRVQLLSQVRGIYAP
ncbi:MAG: LPS export ABC transporter periplasmic protein LptC [Gammaproteobacteria bacterium]|nr:LPS export ABC transporter periplasmic protein LptC [Gammaproteobacteria bacterium]